MARGGRCPDWRAGRLEFETRSDTNDIEWKSSHKPLKKKKLTFFQIVLKFFFIFQIKTSRKISKIFCISQPSFFRAIQIERINKLLTLDQSSRNHAQKSIMTSFLKKKGQQQRHLTLFTLVRILQPVPLEIYIYIASNRE